MHFSHMTREAVVLAAVLTAGALFGERQPMERYQSVIDRQMFGPVPPGFDPTKSPSEVSAKEEREKEQELTKEQEQLKSAVHFSLINVTPAGDTAVGFTDNSDAKNPKHYYLKVGESRDGWTVKEADALAATMTVAKGEIEVDLKLGGNSASGGGTRRAGASPSSGMAQSSRPGGRNLGRPGGVMGLGSLRERRAQREQKRAEEEKARAQAQAEAEAKAAQREAEREAERAAEKAEREREREEQRAQLLQIQQELKKAREEKEKNEAGDKGEGEGNEE